MRIDIKNMFKGENFVTPQILEYGYVGANYYYELSTGSKFMGLVPFGITIKECIHYPNNIKDTDLSKMFTSKKEALDYIKDLNTQIKANTLPQLGKN